jgi:hypothetical protein
MEKHAVCLRQSAELFYLISVTTALFAQNVIPEVQ